MMFIQPEEYNRINDEVNPLHMLSYEEVKNKLIKYPTLLICLNQQTEELCRIAVYYDNWTLQYVNIQTDELCRSAVMNDYWALKYVRKQTEELCLLAVSQNKLAIELVADEFKYLFNK